MSDDNGAMVKHEIPTQEIILEMRIKVTTPKMVATKLAEGISRIIIKGWPNCAVTLEKIQMVSVADAKLAFGRRTQEGDDEGQEEA